MLFRFFSLIMNRLVDIMNRLVYIIYRVVYIIDRLVYNRIIWDVYSLLLEI